MSVFIKLFCFLIILIRLCSFSYGKTLYEGEDCEMKDGTLGICTQVIKCQSIMNALRIPKMRATTFDNLKHCSFIGDMEVVCCPDQKSTPRLGERKAIAACSGFTAEYAKRLGFQILEGNNTSAGEFPHMVALGNLDNRIFELKCGGSLISNRYVLTAAHCTSRTLEPSMIIRLGTIYLNESVLDVSIENITQHPSYRTSQQYHDISLIRLNATVEYTDYILPACLYTDPSDIPNQQVIATGWGTMSTKTRRYSNILLKVSLETVELQKCNQSHIEYAENRRLLNGFNYGHLCAGDSVERQNIGDTCDGDSGGPLQLTSDSKPAEIIGVTSFSVVCGSKIPGVYARVAFYLDWIESIVWTD